METVIICSCIGARNSQDNWNWKNRMKKKITNMLFSMKLTVGLLFGVALVAAVATFVENDYGRETSRAVIYGTHWFEFILFLTGVNLTGSIWRYRMWKSDKIFVFAFHVSFIIILLGAGITRVFGFEGTMHIREGESSSSFLSDRPFLQVESITPGGRDTARRSPVLSPLSSNHFSYDFQTAAGPVKVVSAGYIWRAAEQVVASPDRKGVAYLSMKVAKTGSGPMNAEDLTLSEGDFRNFSEGILSFREEDRDRAAIHFHKEGGQVFFKSASEISWMRMADQATGILPAKKYHPLETGRLYRMGGLSVVVKDIIPYGIRKLIEVNDRNAPSGLILDVTVGGQTHRVEISGMAGSEGQPVQLRSGDSVLRISYGSVKKKLPFSLRLSDFVMQRYPGSSSPSTYESYVVVEDQEQGINEPFHIYMNHILVHRGYRFYQSSYDRDEMGTVLSVANDPGKLPTYIGYTIMTLGFILAPFHKSGRFRKLSSLVSKATSTTGALVLFATVSLLVSGTGGAIQAQPAQSRGNFLPLPEMAEEFSKMPVQDVMGRVKPIDSVAMDVIGKVSRSGEVGGVPYMQAALGMAVDPAGWQMVPMVKVSHPGVNLLLGIGQGQKLVSFAEFFDQSEGNSTYRLLDASEKARRTPESARSKLDKEILKVDERANVAYMTFRGDVFRLFPIPGDTGNKWIPATEAAQVLDPDTASMVISLWTNFLDAVKSGQNERFEKALQDIRDYQNRFGGGVIPGKTVIEGEILFNRLNIFDRLTMVYLLTGFFLLGAVFYQILSLKTLPRLLFLLANGILGIGFVAHTFGLGLRWYVSGHAPWSNGYESLIYISWATILAGFVFARKSSFSLMATSIVGGLALFVAHLSWMDPQITTLVPVLKSYWLTLHVSVISASYGFLALGAILGFLALILFILRSEKRPGIDHSIRELLRIDEMTLMIGLALLSIGNILGAVWANESWGRYWSWDPKETWTFISMLIYAAILHFRFIPPLKSGFAFAVGSLLSYLSILMTYFGVNYYLSGMHSYAAGDPVPIPTFLYYSLAVIAITVYMASKKSDRILPFPKEKK